MKSTRFLITLETNNQIKDNYDLNKSLKIRFGFKQIAQGGNPSIKT